MARGEAPRVPPRTTAIGALAYYASHANPRTYEPTNITFGIITPPDAAPGKRVGRADRKAAVSERALADGSADERRAPAGAVKDHLRTFLDYLSLNRNASAHTVDAYASDVQQFLTFASVYLEKANVTPKDMDIDLVRAFLAELHRQGQSRASASRKLSALRTFMRYLKREGWIETDPASLAVSPKREQRVPAHLSVDEMSQLLDMPDTSGPLGRRDRAILELFYASGLRLSELVGWIWTT